MNQLVSVIIPIYNAERYLEQCVESVLHQTYQNLEILLIDDGSTDRSGNICNALAKKDSRICVYHKLNGGSASARNYALQKASGSYVAFIDSDDYIMPDMIETLVSGLESHDADIAACNYDMVYENGKQRLHPVIFQSDMQLSPQEAIRCLLLEKSYRCYPWNKLYRKELFRNITFPEGVTFDDIMTSYQLFRGAQNVYYVHKSLYSYRLHADSITQRKNKKPEDFNEMIRTVREILKSENYDPQVTAGGLLYYKYFFHDMIKIGAWNDRAYQEAREFYRICRHELHKSTRISVKDKTEIAILQFNHHLYKMLYQMYCFIKERVFR